MFSRTWKSWGLQGSRQLHTFSMLRNRRSELTHRMNEDLKKAKLEFDLFVGATKSNSGTTSSTGQTQTGAIADINDPEHLSRKYRVIPRDSAFYMANPPHEEIMKRLNALLYRNINLPVVTQNKKSSWMSIQEYTAFTGVSKSIKPSAYQTFVRLLNRLDAIDSQLMPEEVKTLLSVFKKKDDISALGNSQERKYKTLDEDGKAICIGRRKAASARVSMVRNNSNVQGQLLINNKPLDMYFSRLQDRHTVLYPLKAVSSVGDYNVFVTVTGGGTSGQAGAIAHGIAQAIVVHNPLLLTRLSRAGCLQRDTRVKERKKPGKPKARKSYTWVKR